MKFKKISSQSSKLNIKLLNILIDLNNNLIMSDIAKKHNVGRNTIYYRVKKLENAKLVERLTRSNFVAFEVTGKGKDLIEQYKKGNVQDLSLRKRSPINVHALKVKYPIIKDNELAKWDKEINVNNWVKKYYKIDIPIGITIEKTTKSIIFHYHTQDLDETDFIDQYHDLQLLGEYYGAKLLKDNFNIEIDPLRRKTLAQHIAFNDKELGKTRQKTRFKVRLGVPSQDIYGKELRQEAELFTDGSPYTNTIETNCYERARRRIIMPETIADIQEKLIPTLDQLSYNIKLHLNTLEEMNKTLKEMRKDVKNRRRND